MEYSDYVESRDDAGALDGSEEVAISKGGVSRKTTTQDIADLGGGVGATPTLQEVLEEGSTGAVNGPVAIASLDDEAGIAGANINIESLTNDIILTSADDIQLDAAAQLDLDPTGDILLNGVAPSSPSTEFLRGDKTWAVPPGVTREFDRAWDDELLFDKNEIHYAEHTLTGDVEFTINPDGNLEDQFCSIVQEIVTDGTHEVTFTGFKYVLGDVQTGSTPEAGTHIVFFLYFNGVATVNWSIPTSEVANLIPLSAPANFAAVADGDDEIDLSWDVVANVTSYEIYFSTTGGGGPWTLLTEPAAAATTYSHTGLTAATTYHYRIRAIGDQVTFSNSQYSTTAQTTEDSGDVTAPTFTFEPADAATGIAVNHPITITASEPLIDDDGTTVIDDSNVANYIVLKEDDGAGANIAFTATIDVTKTIITVTPNVVYPSLGDVFCQIDGVEDVNGNESTADDATFTTSDYTEMEANYLHFQTQIDSVLEGADVDWELEAEYDAFLQTSTDRGLFQKYSSGSSESQKSFVIITNSANVIFRFYDGLGKRREITWANALSGFTSGKLTFKYFGAVDTNNGLDRMAFYIDDVLVSAGKSLTDTNGAWPFDLASNSQSFSLNGPTFREVKNFKVRNNSGATTIVDVPVIRTGTDVSGNSFDGTWV